SAASCFANRAATPCAGAFSVGQVVSAFSAVEPALPATTFMATTALLRNRLVVQTAGASVVLAPATFVIRGVTIDASALTGVALPAVGDQVRVVGTVESNGTGVTAT